MEEQISLWKQEKFSQRILCNSRRILQSPVPKEHPAYAQKHMHLQK